jgi:drug/metabolite transporter (DMT)-like permease
MHIILVGDYTRRHSVAALSVLQVAACAALAWLATGLASAAGFERVRFGWQAQSLLGIATCAVLATAVAFSVQLWAQQYTSSSHAAVLFTLEPVFASATSYILLRERLGRRALLGAGFVLAGILIAELLGPPAAPESPEPTAENVASRGSVAQGQGTSCAS